MTLIAAPVVTCAVVGAGIVAAGSGEDQTAPAPQAAAVTSTVDRTLGLSRSAERQVLPQVAAHRWTTVDLDLRLKPTEDAATRGELDAYRKIGVTGLRRAGFTQVVVKRKAYWVTGEYLTKKKPTDPASLPIGGKPCPGTSGVEQGLTPGAIRVYRAVCNNFPQITSYGGLDNHGEHGGGRALDIMTSDVALGTAIADFLRANAAELNLYNVIWRQRIFTQERGGEGWRFMPSRGSATANHYDHIHVSVY